MVEKTGLAGDRSLSINADNNLLSFEFRLFFDTDAPINDEDQEIAGFPFTPQSLSCLDLAALKKGGEKIDILLPKKTERCQLMQQAQANLVRGFFHLLTGAALSGGALPEWISAIFSSILLNSACNPSLRTIS